MEHLKSLVIKKMKKGTFINTGLTQLMILVACLFFNFTLSNAQTDSISIVGFAGLR